MTVYAKEILSAFRLEGVSFTLDESSRRRLMAISAIPFLAMAAMVAESWLTVAIGWPPTDAPEALERGHDAAASAGYVLSPLSLAVLVGAGSLELSRAERKWALALALSAGLVSLGLAATVIVMSLGLGRWLAIQHFIDTWGNLGFRLALLAAGYVYCARPRRHSTS